MYVNYCRYFEYFKNKKCVIKYNAITYTIKSEYSDLRRTMGQRESGTYQKDRKVRKCN